MEETLSNQADKMTWSDEARQPLLSATPEIEATHGPNITGIRLTRMMLQLLLSNVQPAINRD